MGFASSLHDLVSEALSIQPGAPGWRNKTCGEAHGRNCADQWIYGHLLAQMGHRFNVTLDYSRRVFYVASSHDWSYSTALKRINETQPCVVHMPFIQAPRVNATLQALYAGLVLKHPPPEADRDVCLKRAARCKDISVGVTELLHALEESIHNSTPHGMLAGIMRLIGSNDASVPENTMVATALGVRDTRLVSRTKQADCGRTKAAAGSCSRASNMINSSTWSLIALLTERMRLGGVNVKQVRDSPLRKLLRNAIWDEQLPWCFEPGSGVHTTWISC